VGGTGLYVSSLIDNLTFDEEPADPALREALYAEAREKGNAQLLCRLRTVDPETAAGLHENNLGRIVRALEIFEKTGKTMAWHKEQSRRNPSPYRLCMLGLTCRDRRILYDRIDARVDAMMETGLLDETRRLLAQYGEQKMLAAIGYKELAGYLQGKTPLCDAVAYLKQQTRRYAKRQLTWFQKDARITWIYIDEQPGLNAIIEKAEEQIQNEKLL
jgi:tRNA dimethylallyltransferase